MGLGIFTLVGVIMLVLSGASFGYLLQVRNKSRSSQMLLWFFLCVMLSSVATIVTNSRASWAWAFAPTQDALIILGGLFLVRYAYIFPSGDQPRESRVIISLYLILVLVALGYAIFFAFLYISNLPAQIDENRAIYLITPLAIFLVVLIFFRRSFHFSSLQYDQTGVEKNWWNVFNFLVKPTTFAALGLRNFGLAVAIGLIPVLIFLTKTMLLAVLSTFLFNFGVVIAIGAVMLVYLNHAPEPTTISAKLAGVSMVMVLLILGFIGVWFTINIPADQVHSMVRMLILLVLFSSLLIILFFPLFFQPALLRPLSRLLEGVKEVNQGNLDIQVAVNYDDEVGFLTRSFNRMVNSLKVMTYDLEKTAYSLEAQVSERTQDLQATNECLAREINDRIEIEAKLDRQLAYEQALAGCSRLLLLPGEDEQTRINVLTRAIEYLRTGANASRVYIFENFNDSSHGLSMRMLAETCAPGIQPHIHNPANQNFPWALLPSAMVEALKIAHPYGGPTEKVFQSTPDLLENFLDQDAPLLSIQLFPVFIENQWWGFIGFDDCNSPREWEPREISMLQTASEMVGNTVQRWQVEKNLQDTLRQLEERVQLRTMQYVQANQELTHEIYERQRYQEDLLDRLKIERALAKISTRLLTTMRLEFSIGQTLADLGEMIDAGSVLFIQAMSVPVKSIPEVLEWHRPEEVEFQPVFSRSFLSDFSWVSSQLKCNEIVSINNLSEIPESALDERNVLIESGLNSLLAIPLCVEDELTGVIVCNNLKSPKSVLGEHNQTLAVIADMLSSLLHRAALINLLEEKVAKRTRELSAFFDMTLLAGDAQELTDILQPALVKIMEISALDAAIIHVNEEEQHNLRLIAQRGLTSESSTRLQKVFVDQQIAEWLHHIAIDAPSEKMNISFLPELFRYEGFRSSAFIPLRARGKLQGILSCYRESDTLFDPYQINFLSIIGEQMGMAVENYRLRLRAEEIATLQERQRLARDLHDAVSQSLYSLVLYARSGRDAFEANDWVKLIDSLEQVEVNSQTALREMRLLLYQLRSWSLEAGGFVKALKSRLELVESRSGIKTLVSVDETIEMPVQVEQELFRLVTEALNNALKHSEATQVSVSLEKENGWLVLNVTDNGKGFDAAQTFAGMGLHNMRERAIKLGGKFELQSKTGEGTHIRVAIPHKHKRSPTGDG